MLNLDHILRYLQRLQNLKSSREEDKSSLEARYKQQLKQMDVKLKEVAKRGEEVCKGGAAASEEPGDLPALAK